PLAPIPLIPGCFDIGLPSKLSLFHLQAQRIIALQQLSSGSIPWYIMTSEPTRAQTESFFNRHNHFGLDPANVCFFNQGLLPCLTSDAKIILHDKHAIALAPDGNGGLYRALLTNGVLKDMTDRAIKHVHVYCVDNALVRVADPLFIGFAASRNAKLATKVVRKRNAAENVGLVVAKHGKPAVIEYSELDPQTASLKDSHGLLQYGAANIVNHYYSIDFLLQAPQWIDTLPHHIAHKKIPYCDPSTGSLVSPSSPNGIKLEQFIFDVFPLVEMHQFACFEVDRKDEFSPLKNARGTGQDDPDTCRDDILAQGKRWVEKACAVVLTEGVEISPLLSYAGEGLENYVEA
ncbi:UDP-N-acetylglucosamine pyrophosphorylase, partial [Neolecta irregularis DAH-3]